VFANRTACRDSGGWVPLIVFRLGSAAGGKFLAPQFTLAVAGRRRRQPEGLPRPVGRPLLLSPRISRVAALGRRIISQARSRRSTSGKGAVVLGVSVDSADSHKQFCTKEGPELQAPGGHQPRRCPKLIGSANKSRTGEILLPVTPFLIVNPEGKVARVFTGVNPSKHSEEVLSAPRRIAKAERRVPIDPHGDACPPHQI